ncbi:aspartyl-tRNA amidotransferase subunit B [Patiriisocius marinistellae]|uniref:Aspartyl-tRNA amidotransferase subunit B n=1 Tax=Patiriisocius marinistellae TaxID=2494560 RepID=A0A5J4FZY5_9FLAO|nr:GatB/YqeY domain-containing protein [Patiriisocius marinistellae]GEQ87008.1 aspartyl-tRNA amidotransferase subunit B [Patiriisocius marinistellae]
MSLSSKIMEAMKIAMKAKDSQALQALRSVKSAILLAQTESGAKEELNEDAEMRILQKLVKQRKDSAAIFSEQGREDLAAPEIAEAAVIERFLPAQLSEEEVAKLVDEAITQTGASSMADMGKVMGIVNGKAAGRADGKTISTIVKARLAN